MTMIVGEGGPQDRQSLELMTSKKRRIPNTRRLEAPPDRRKVVMQQFQTAFPEAKIRSVSQCYNCMGLAFASRRTAIDVDELQNILDDDEYSRVPKLNEAMVGDLVVYMKDARRQHIGVIVQKEPNVSKASWDIKLMSQWGWDAELIHSVEGVPMLYGKPVEIWTDRKVPI